jgi:cysteine synthase
MPPMPGSVSEMTSRTEAVMARRGEIMQHALGMDYGEFERSPIAFDYEALMAAHGYSLPDIIGIQRAAGVGDTPLLELRNLTDLVRSHAAPGHGARLFVKDEAANMAGSFKDRRASISTHVAREKGYAGVIAATSGNYGAAVASQAARASLACIIVQEAFDSAHLGQPEIIEKARLCEAFGAEVVQLTVGPELFAHMLELLDETGYFAASLYSSFGVSGIETLGFEIAEEMRALTGAPPTHVVVTHAGGGNTTGTARGLKRAGATGTQIVSASVDLSGLHMASDADFNRKSFTTGHTGFGVPFATWPDRADVPRNAARSLRYMDRYLTVTQGEVFYVTEALAKLEGLERGPSGNTALAAAMSLACDLPAEATVVVQETEYTGAGKHHWAQLNFARERGVEVRVGDPTESVPGRSIVIPESPEQIRATDFDLGRMRRSYVRNALGHAPGDYVPTADDIVFLAEDTNSTPDAVEEIVAGLAAGE